MENTQVGPFKVLQKVGNRRRHNVYHARQVEQNRDVALKFISLPPDVDREKALAKIHHEVRVVKRLEHDHIVQLLGAGTFEDKVFFAHELIDGESVSSLLVRLGRLAPDLVVEYGIQLASALEYLHHNELIHAKLTADKVIVTADGQIKLGDVRLNRSRKRRWDAAKRATLETAAYMPCEQLMGEGSIPKSDLYALGILLYEMVTGKLPFEPQTMHQLVCDKQANKAKRVTEHVMNCPALLDKLIHKLIQTNAKNRPHSARAVRMTLEQIRQVDQSKRTVAEEMSGGFSALTAGKDRTEARKLLGKNTKKKKQTSGPLLQSLPFLAAGLAVIGLVIGIFMFVPFSGSRQDMMTTADALLDSGNPEDWRQARRLYNRIMQSSDTALAATARTKYNLARRKSMLNRLTKGVTGLDKPEIREFNKGFQMQRENKPDEALAFFQTFVVDYDHENNLSYVFDEAKERLDHLASAKQEYIDNMTTVDKDLQQAEQQVMAVETRAQARQTWVRIIDEFDENPFFAQMLKPAHAGIAATAVTETQTEETSNKQSTEQQEPSESEQGSGSI